jgi:hypothetical protein
MIVKKQVSIEELFCLTVAWEMKLPTKLVLMVLAVLVNLLHLKLHDEEDGICKGVHE